MFVCVVCLVVDCACVVDAWCMLGVCVCVWVVWWAVLVTCFVIV